MKKISALLAFFLPLSCLAQGSLSSTAFFEKMNAQGISFMMLPQYDEIAVDSSVRVKYDFAVIDPSKKIQVLYKVNKYPTGENIMVKPELLYRGATTALVMNISQNANGKIESLQDKSVKNDFNADWGMQGVFKNATGSLHKDAKEVFMISYAKSNRAMVYVFYLFDEKPDQASFSKVLRDTYTALRFSDSTTIHPRTAADMRRSREERKADFYKDSLHVNDEQLQKLLEADKKYSEEFAAILKEKYPPAQRATKVKWARENQESLFKTILTPEQFENWKRIETARDARLRSALLRNNN